MRLGHAIGREATFSTILHAHCTSGLRKPHKHRGYRHRLSIPVNAFYTLLSAKTIRTGAGSVIVTTGVSGFPLTALGLNGALMLVNGTFGH